jgi:hypothetical protein
MSNIFRLSSAVIAGVTTGAGKIVGAGAEMAGGETIEARGTEGTGTGVDVITETVVVGPGMIAGMTGMRTTEAGAELHTLSLISKTDMIQSCIDA